MAKIDHAAVRTTAYEDAQKFFEDVFKICGEKLVRSQPANAGTKKESSSAKRKLSTQTGRTATTIFPLR